MEEKPNYYAILTAEVRYDERLTSTEKLLYAEITALTNKEGICWASNHYFSKLYNVTPDYIRKMIRKLEKYNYIKTQLIFKDKRVVRRNIYLSYNSMGGDIQKYGRGIIQKYGYNNINNNNINRIIPLNNFSKEDLDKLYEN